MFGGDTLKFWRDRMKSYLQLEGIAFPGHEDGLHYHSGAPTRPGGASIAIEISKPIKLRKFGYDDMSVRTSVCPYARIRPGDESFLRKKSGKNIFGSLRVVTCINL